MYIDSSTLWVIAIGLGIAIATVYYSLKQRINKVDADLAKMQKILSTGGRAIAEAVDNDGRKRNKERADIYYTLGAIFQILQVYHESANKKQSNEIGKILADLHRRTDIFKEEK